MSDASDDVGAGAADIERLRAAAADIQRLANDVQIAPATLQAHAVALREVASRLAALHSEVDAIGLERDTMRDAIGDVLLRVREFGRQQIVPEAFGWQEIGTDAGGSLARLRLAGGFAVENAPDRLYGLTISRTIGPTWRQVVHRPPHWFTPGYTSVFRWKCTACGSNGRLLLETKVSEAGIVERVREDHGRVQPDCHDATKDDDVNWWGATNYLRAHYGDRIPDD